MDNRFIKLNSCKDIHGYLDGGFSGSTEIKLLDGNCKRIKDIVVNDELENGEKVYGIVEIDGKNLNKQYKYYLGNNIIIEGGPNLNICDKKLVFSSTINLDSKNGV
jgi:hypothetical protein